jgi:hypothetical protein
LVPPKPKELVITVSSPASSTSAVAISAGWIASSRVSTLIDGDDEIVLQHQRQKIASSAPAAPCAWPVIDFRGADRRGQQPSPKMRRTASISPTSPTGVEVPWALM